MNILLLGSGGREHALSWKLVQSDHCGKLYIAPGNAGTTTLGTNLSINILDFKAVSMAIDEYAIDMLIIGPEEPLVKGIRDALSSKPGLIVIGPDAAGAALEGSKAFAKEFMKAANIPTASYASFTSDQSDQAIAYLEEMTPPYVIKADGLAAGKGVIITESKEEASDTIREMLLGKFGNASTTLVLESFLEGIEYSVFVISDGLNWKMLPVAKDYKRVGEGDTGPNTGGMGAVCPVPFFTPSLKQKTIDRIVQPTMDELVKREITYKGFIFIGLINVGGDPYVIEYNCRMGDPETEVVMPALKNDLVEIFLAIHKGTLKEVQIDQTEMFTCTIMLCSGGYPGDYNKGISIHLPEVIPDDTYIFHAGTKELDNQQLVTNGGRVLAITSQAEDITTALAQSLEIADAIQYEGKFYRKDIGFDL